MKKKGMKHVNWESLGNKSHKLRKPSRLHQSVKLSSFLDFMREVRFRVHLCKNSYFSWLVRWSRSEIKEAGTCQRLPKMVAEVGGGRRTTTVSGKIYRFSWMKEGGDCFRRTEYKERARERPGVVT